MNYKTALNEEILKDLGESLRQQRINHSLTSAELARKSGVSMRTINGFERGEKNISLVNFMELLRALGLVDNLKELIPKLPPFNPIQMMEIEKKKRKRVRK